MPRATAAAKASMVMAAAAGVALILVVLSATYFRNAVAYNYGVESGRLSNQGGVGYFTDDPVTISLLGQIDLTGVDEDDGADTDYAVLKGAPVPRKGAPASAAAESPARELLDMDRPLAEALRGVEVPTIWTLAPLVLFSDDERHLATSFARHARRDPSAFRIAPEGGDEGGGSGSGSAALLGYLWYAQSLVLPKLERLVQSGQPYAGQRLARSTADILSSFTIDNDQLDPITLRRLNAVFLAEALFERPLEILRSRKEAVAAIRDLEIMMDPEAEQSERSDEAPPSFSLIADLSRDVGLGIYDDIDGTALDALHPTRREANLIGLLLVRAAFWSAWEACAAEGRTANCPAAKASFEKVAADHGSRLTRASFSRDLGHYRSEAAAW